MICCRGTADEAMAAMRRIMEQLKLTINEQKTRLCRVPDESFDFLGYTIGRCYSPKTGKACIGTRPSQQKIVRLCREISELTSRRWALLPVEDRVKKINRKLIGWSNYFCLGPVRRHTSPERRPSPLLKWLGFHTTRFEACSTFTHVTACPFADPPGGPFLEVLQSDSLPP